MIVRTKMDMDLALPRIVPELYVVQDDRYSRCLEVSLNVNGIPLMLPEGYTVLIRYVKPDGKNGAYDTLPDGSQAWSIRENHVSVVLAPQVCSTAGKVSLMATLIQNEFELTTFTITIQVVGRPKGIPDSRNYVNITGFLPQPAVAQPGKCLKVAWVDEYGRAAGLDCVDIEGLPIVSEEQEGQFLRVVEGKWAPAVVEKAEEVQF